MKLLLLPGMDGTGALFERFVRALPESLEPTVGGYPPDVELGYDELLARIEVPSGRYTIVAESFSGPLGIELAARSSDVIALVLVASFATAPRSIPRLLARLSHVAFAMAPPAFALRRFLLGHDADDALVEDLERAITSVSPHVLARRLVEIGSVDKTEALARVEVPLLYLAGEHDALVPRALGEAMAGANRTIRTLDAPHLVLQRRPVEAAAVITSFLEPLA